MVAPRDAEGRKSNLIGDRFKLDLQGEIQRQLRVGHVPLGKACDQPHSLLHISKKDSVRDVGRECRMECLVYDCPAVNSSPASGRRPVPTNRMTQRTHRARWVSPAGALLAALEVKLSTRTMRIESGPHRVF